jgi:hypothetical protein
MVGAGDGYQSLMTNQPYSGNRSDLGDADGPDAAGVPSTGDAPAAPARPDAPAGAEDLDPRENLLGDDPDEVMQTGYDPPDREPYSLRDPPTAAEERATPTTDERLSEEVPDVGEGQPADDVRGAAFREATGGEPAPRAGRLVTPDAGTQDHPPGEPDEIASDPGPAGYASSAEEAAVHIVGPDDET